MKNPLQIAIENDDADGLARALKDDPSAARRRDDAGLTPLMQALYQHRFDLVEPLRAAAQPLDPWEAAAVGDVARLGALVARDPACAETPAADGMAPLHLAAYFRQPEAARLLLELGADPDLESSNPARLRALHAAAAAGHGGILRLLLERGAEVDAAQHGGWTALMSCAKRGDVELVTLLLDHGADPARQADSGETAADLASDDLPADLRGRLGMAKA